MKIIRAHGGVTVAVRYTRRFDGMTERDVAGYIGDVFGCVASVYRPIALVARLDSFVPDDLGMAEDGPCKAVPREAHLLELGSSIVPRYLREATAPTAMPDRLDPSIITAWLVELLAGAMSTGHGRPGISLVEAPAGAARLPAEMRNAPGAIEFHNEHDRSSVMHAGPHGWVEGPSSDGDVPPPVRAYVYREDWTLVFKLEFYWDVFTGVNTPVIPEVQDAIECLMANGWTRDPSSEA